MVFNVKNVEYVSDQDFKWQGEIYREDENDSLCSSGFLTLVYNSALAGLTGDLAMNGYAYELHTLAGSDVIAFVRMNREGLNELGCGMGYAEVENGEPGGDPHIAPELPCVKNIVKILMVYTPAASAILFNDINFVKLNAQSSIFKMNSVLANSYSQRRVELAGVELHPTWVEEEYIDNETNLFAADAMVANWRNLYKADICVLMSRNKDYKHSVKQYGWTRQIASYNPFTGVFDPAYAFSVVDMSYSTTRLSFQHEMGHIFGGRHHNEDPTDTRVWMDPTARGNFFATHIAGFIRTGAYRTTVTNKDYWAWGPNWFTHANVVPYYSNPQIFYDGVPTGEHDHNNTKRIKNHYPNIAAIYTDIVGFSNGISHVLINLPPNPPYVAYCDKKFRLTAEVAKCSRPPYTNQWYMSYDGINWISIGSGDNIEIPGTYGAVFVRLTTTDGAPQTVTTQVALPNVCRNTLLAETTDMHKSHSAQVQDNQPGMAITHENQAAFTLSPNPNSGTFVVQYILPVADKVTITLLDLTGRTIQSFIQW